MVLDGGGARLGAVPRCACLLRAVGRAFEVCSSLLAQSWIAWRSGPHSPSVLSLRSSLLAQVAWRAGRRSNLPARGNEGWCPSNKGIGVNPLRRDVAIFLTRYRSLMDCSVDMMLNAICISTYSPYDCYTKLVAIFKERGFTFRTQHADPCKSKQNEG